MVPFIGSALQSDDRSILDEKFATGPHVIASTFLERISTKEHRGRCRGIGYSCPEASNSPREYAKIENFREFFAKRRAKTQNPADVLVHDFGSSGNTFATVHVRRFVVAGRSCARRTRKRPLVGLTRFRRLQLSEIQEKKELLNRWIRSVTVSSNIEETSRIVEKRRGKSQVTFSRNRIGRHLSRTVSRARFSRASSLGKRETKRIDRFQATEPECLVGIASRMFARFRR